MTVSADELRTIIREELAAAGIPSEHDSDTSQMATPRLTARILLPDIIRQIVREEMADMQTRLDPEMNTHF